MYGGVGHQDYQDNIDGQENNDMYALLKRMSFQRPPTPRTSMLDGLTIRMPHLDRIRPQGHLVEIC